MTEREREIEAALREGDPMIGPYGEPNEAQQAPRQIGCETCILTVDSDGSLSHEERCTIEMYRKALAGRDARLARLVEAVDALGRVTIDPDWEQRYFPAALSLALQRIMAARERDALMRKIQPLEDALAHVTGRAPRCTHHFWPKVCEGCGKAEELLNNRETESESV